MELETPNGMLTALPMQPVHFSGALPVTGRLPGGPIRDLNVMLRDGCYRGEVARLGELPEEKGLRMLHVAAGRLRVGDGIAGPGATVIAPEGWIEGSGGADVLDIRIMPEG